MIDPDRLDGVLRRGPEVKEQIDAFRAVDSERRAVQSNLDGQRMRRNAANDEMAKIKDKKSPEFAAKRDEMREVSQAVKAGEEQLAKLEEEARRLILYIPNAPHPSVPEGGGVPASMLPQPP